VESYSKSIFDSTNIHFQHSFNSVDLQEISPNKFVEMTGFHERGASRKARRNIPNVTCHFDAWNAEKSL